MGFITSNIGTKPTSGFDSIFASILNSIKSFALVWQSWVLATERTAGKIDTPQVAENRVAKIFAEHPENEFAKEEDRDRNAAILDRELSEKEPRQSVIDDAVLELSASTVLLEIVPGEFDSGFEKLFEGLKPEVAKRKDFLGIGRYCDAFEKQTYIELCESAVLEGLRDGIHPASMQAATLEWWNRQADAGKTADKNSRKFQKIQNKPTVIAIEAALGRMVNMQFTKISLN